MVMITTQWLMACAVSAIAWAHSTSPGVQDLEFHDLLGASTRTPEMLGCLNVPSRRNALAFHTQGGLARQQEFRSHSPSTQALGLCPLFLRSPRLLGFRSSCRMVKSTLLNLRMARKRGAKNVNAKLAAAAVRGDLDLVIDLIAQGSNASATDEWGSSCLNLAIKGGHVQVAKYLLEEGADPAKASMSDDETTTLHTAASFNQPEIAAILLLYGVDVDATDEFGSSALDIALKKKHSAVSDVLREPFWQAKHQKQEEESQKKRQKEEEMRLKDFERATTRGAVGQSFTQSQANEMVNEYTDWEAAALGRDGGDAGDLVQLIEDGETGKQYVRKLPLKQGADVFFPKRERDPDASQ